MHPTRISHPESILDTGNKLARNAGMRHLMLVEESGSVRIFYLILLYKCAF